MSETWERILDFALNSVETVLIQSGIEVQLIVISLHQS